MWDALTPLQKVYFCIAVFFTVILVIQFILLLVGVGQNADGDLDLDGDGQSDLDIADSEGLVPFTLKGIIAFFAVGGWVGFALGDGSIAGGWAIVISLAAGFLALLGVGFLLKWIMRLQSTGSLDANNAVGKVAEVYLTIPANCTGNGKINLEVQGQYVELEAINEGNEPIKTGEKVKVIKTEGFVCVVEKLYK